MAKVNRYLVYFTRGKLVFHFKTRIIEASTSWQIPQKLAVRLELVLLLIIQNHTATFSAIKKAAVGCKKSFHSSDRLGHWPRLGISVLLFLPNLTNNFILDHSLLWLYV